MKVLIFEKKSVILFLNLKKISVSYVLVPNFSFFECGLMYRRYNKFLLSSFFNEHGFLHYKKFSLTWCFLLNDKLTYGKKLIRLISKFSRKFVLGYFGYYLGYIVNPVVKKFKYSQEPDFLSKKKRVNFFLFEDKFLDTEDFVVLNRMVLLWKRKMYVRELRRRHVYYLRVKLFSRYDARLSLLQSCSVNLRKFLRVVPQLDIRPFNISRIPRTWLIHLRETHSNLMLTLTNSSGRVIACHTSGSSGLKGKKKTKISHRAIEHIFKRLIPYLRIFDVKMVTIIMYRMQTPALEVLIDSVLSFGLSIVSFVVRILRAHNGVRKRKSR